ncbi:hypothetical protein [Streptacidiphilus sp. EB129]|uniref:hypothetical protein n=1 Tax=Streptacidiphilus sp. EB129 TaxID=3156262 RepID=UPI003511277C
MPVLPASVCSDAPATTPGRAAALDLRVLRALPFATVCVVVSALGHCLGGGGSLPPLALLTGWLAVWALATALAGRERSLPAIAAGLAVGQLGLHLLFHLLAGSGMGAMAGMTGGTGTAGAGGAAGMGAMAGMPGMAAGTGGSALDQLAERLLCGPDGSPALPLPPGTSAAQIVSRAGIDPHLVLSTAPHLPFWTHASLLGLTPLMLLCHLVAAVVAGWWLRRGEAAVWRLLRLTAQLTETLAETWTAPLRTLLALAAALLRGLLGALLPPGTIRRTGLADAPRRPRATPLRHQVTRRGPPAVLTA